MSEINCSENNSYKDMMLTKERFNKKDGILGFHAFQSFKEGEVTPEMAHEIGVKLANEMWGDRFEVIVSTHQNTNHIHNHFVINSVSFKDGKKYYDNRENYAELRHLSDSLCEEYGLSVLKEKTCKKSDINYSNYNKVYIQNNNYYTVAKQDIDRAISQAYSYQDFENLMRVMDYEIFYRANKISIRRQPYKKNIRIERCFGIDYSINRIKDRIEVEQAPRVPFIEEYSNKKNLFKQSKTLNKKSKGFYSLYLYYCYLLKEFPNKYPRKKLPASIRADVIKMEQISKETIFLDKYKIKTDYQFFLFMNNNSEKLKSLMDKRGKLWYKHKTSNSIEDKEKIRKEIESLNVNIKEVREIVNFCSSIRERIDTIKNNIKEFEENIERKEKEIDERIK